jgi:dolichol-phosphate mannosyltransferase
MRVLVVLPTYNESENIEQVLRAVRTSLPSADILVVDDSSPDGTADIAKRAGGDLGQVEVIVRPEKNGLGPAYRAGFSWGVERGYDAFVEMDSDFSHDPAAIPSLVSAVEAGADLAIGSRYVPGGSIPQWSFQRRMLSRFGNVYADALLGLAVRDSTAGFRVYTAAILNKIDLSTVQADGYGFQIEMTYRTKCAGGTIKEVPIRFTDRVEGESKMSRSTVTEALAMVTRWGAVRAFEAVRRVARTKRKGLTTG